MSDAADPKTSRIDLLELVNNCDCDLERMASFIDSIHEDIKSFDPECGFGTYLYEHLKHTGKETEDFLLFQGYSAREAKIVGMAFSLHDIGKTLQDPKLWRIQDANVERTPDEKAERVRHTEYGLIVLKTKMEEKGFVPTEKENKFFVIVETMMLYHHEYVNGTGPRKLTGKDICRMMASAIAVDTEHGRRKKGHDQIHNVHEMQRGKFIDRVDQAVAALFERFVLKRVGLSANPYSTLAMNKVS